jgi:hypothetical protein
MRNEDDRILKIRGQSRYFGKFGVRAHFEEIAQAAKRMAAIQAFGLAPPDESCGHRRSTPSSNCQKMCSDPEFL